MRRHASECAPRMRCHRQNRKWVNAAAHTDRPFGYRKGSPAQASCHRSRRAGPHSRQLPCQPARRLRRRGCPGGATGVQLLREGRCYPATPHQRGQHPLVAASAPASSGRAPTKAVAGWPDLAQPVEAHRKTILPPKMPPRKPADLRRCEPEATFSRHLGTVPAASRTADLDR